MISIHCFAVSLVISNSEAANETPSQNFQFVHRLIQHFHLFLFLNTSLNKKDRTPGIFTLLPNLEIDRCRDSLQFHLISGTWSYNIYFYVVLIDMPIYI